MVYTFNSQEFYDHIDMFNSYLCGQKTVSNCTLYQVVPDRAITFSNLTFFKNDITLSLNEEEAYPIDILPGVGFMNLFLYTGCGEDLTFFIDDLLSTFKQLDSKDIQYTKYPRRLFADGLELTIKCNAYFKYIAIYYRDTLPYRGDSANTMEIIKKVLMEKYQLC